MNSSQINFKLTGDIIADSIIKILNYLADNELVVNAHYKHKNVLLPIKRDSYDRIYFGDTIIRGITIDRSIRWFRIDYDRAKAIEQIDDLINHLSVNQKKKIKKVITQINNKITYSNCELLLKFIRKYLGVMLTTLSGFEGDNIEIIEVSQFNQLGIEKHNIRMKIKQQVDKLDSVRKEENNIINKIATLKNELKELNKK